VNALITYDASEDRETPVLETTAPQENRSAPGEDLPARSFAAQADDSMREFAMLHDCSADEWRTLLADEPPQAVAVILSRIPPAQSAFVLRLMPAGVRLDVVRRMAAMDRPSSAVLGEFASVLEERLRNLRQCRLTTVPERTEAAPVRGNKTISPILETLGRELSPGIATPTTIPPAEFEDVQMLDDGSLRELFASFDVEHWSIALKGADDAIRTKLQHSLSADDAASLQQAVDNLGAVRLSDVDSAQQAIAKRLTPLRWRGRRTNRIRRLEEAAT
jgi:flagellar motor switch protein FliG